VPVIDEVGDGRLIDEIPHYPAAKGSFLGADIVGRAPGAVVRGRRAAATAEAGAPWDARYFGLRTTKKNWSVARASD
jgi:hypothetical protein